MRRSGRLALDLSSISDSSDLESLRTAFVSAESHLESLLNLMTTQLGIFDEIDIGSDRNTSVLLDISSRLQTLESYYLRDKLLKLGIDNVLEKVVDKKEAIIEGDYIYGTRGTPNTTSNRSNVRGLNHSRSAEKLKTMRLSFSNVKYVDSDSVLKKSDLLEMTDLDYLLRLNAYELPYSREPKGRRLYQEFFGVLINILTEESTDYSVGYHLFTVLQGIVYYYQVIAEYSISLVECVLEMITLLNTRIKLAPMTIERPLNIKPFDHPMLDHIISCFSDSSKIYLNYRQRKLITTCTSDQSSDWKSKIEEYHYALTEALERYASTCDSMLDSCVQFKEKSSKFQPVFISADESSKIVKMELILSKTYVYIDSLKGFIFSIVNDQPYSQFYDSANQILDLLNDLERKHPIRYGDVTPRGTTPRTSRISARITKSNNGSPRTESPPISPSGSVRTRVSK